MAQLTHSRIGPRAFWNALILRLSGADRLDDRTAGLAMTVGVQPTSMGSRTAGQSLNCECLRRVRAVTMVLLLARLAFSGAGRPLQ